MTSHVPKKRYRPDHPPELVIEILSTPRGNVERTEKLDDYARGGIREYWIVNPFDRCVEVYVLTGPEYQLKETVGHGSLCPEPLPRRGRTCRRNLGRIGLTLAFLLVLQSIGNRGPEPAFQRSARHRPRKGPAPSLPKKGPDRPCGFFFIW